MSKTIKIMKEDITKQTVDCIISSGRRDVYDVHGIAQMKYFSRNRHC